MTKEKFEKLCEQVLMPRLGDLMHVQLTDLHQTLDIMSQEIIRIGNRLDQMVVYVNRHGSHEDHGG